MFMHHAARHRPHQACLQFDCLEDRFLPSTVAVIREVTGPNAAALQATVDAFRADLGDPNNGNAVGPLAAGRRQITWDGADADSAPSRLPADFFNAVAPRGAIFGGDPRIQFQQSADGVGNNPTNTVEEFGQFNATYPTAFGTFSAPRLFASLTHNVFEVRFVIPGTNTPAGVRGFGAVFTDVDVAVSSKIEFFDLAGQRVFERNILATPGDASLSFLGVAFARADVSKVRITAGNAALGPNDITQGGTNDIVALDDFIYGEPQPLPPPRIVVGAGAGGAPQVKVFDAATGGQLRSFLAYPGAATGGVRVASADVTGDGVADIITAPGAGVRADIKVFDGVGFNQVKTFRAFPASFKGGAFVAAADINGDSRAEIIVGAGKGRGDVKVYSGANLQLLRSLFPFGNQFKGGVTVAAGDLNGDFSADFVAGQQSGGSRVSAFNGQNGAQLSSFAAFGGFKGGVTVATGDLDGNGIAEILTGQGPTGKSAVNVFTVNGTLVKSVFVFGVNLKGGLNVASSNITNDRRVANLIAAPGEGGPPRVRIVGLPFGELDGFFAFGANLTRGAFVAASR